MDLGILVGIALIVIWGIGALVYEAPGWIHLLLTVGVFVVIWRIVVRGGSFGSARDHERSLAGSFASR